MQCTARWIAVAAFCFLSGIAPCATIYVDDDNTSEPWDGTMENPYYAIQDAIDAAGPGDRIEVAEGYYGGLLRFEDKNDIELRGAGAETTVISGQRAGTVIEVVGSSVSIHGFTIMRSRDEPGGYYAVWVRESRIHLHDNTITENRGGIYAYACPPEQCPNPIGPSDLIIERNRITECSTSGSIEITRSTGLIASNVIADNANTAIRTSGAPIDVLGNTIVNNSGLIGGISTTPHGKDGQRILNNVITGNQIGIYILGGIDSEALLVEISHNDVWNNPGGNYIEGWGGIGYPSYEGPFVPQPAIGEISVDPEFVDPDNGEYSLRPGSPCIDAGSPPEEFTGVPCADVGAGHRLRDADGDGLARHDMGAFEHEDPNREPGEVANVGWAAFTPDRLTWDAEPSSDAYDVYRGDLAALGYASWGSCLGTTSNTTFDDPEQPQPGTGFFYTVGGRQAGGGVGTNGFATCAERSNFSSCP